jgi:hypothetical protein
LPPFLRREPAYRIFPEPGGLLSWGSNQLGDVFWWLTEGEPEQWPVIMWARGPVRTFRFDGGMVEFLCAILSGDSAALPAGLESLCHDEHIRGTAQWTMTTDWLGRDIDQR